MRAISAHSLELDAYDAGRELGEQLRAIEPELVILFSSVHYDFAEQYQGLRDGLGAEVLVFGGTGDGFFETGGDSPIGVAALGIDGGGAMRVFCHVEEGLGADSFAVARRCGEALKQVAGDAPIRLAMVLFESLACPDNRVVEGINAALDCPVFGGIVADDRKLERCYVIRDGVAYQDAIGMLGFTGDFRFAIEVENGTGPVSATGVVEAAEGNTLVRISGRSALAFIAEQLGKGIDSFTDFDVGLVNLQCSAHPDMSESQFRSVAKWAGENGSVETFGPVDVGQYVRVAIATGDDLISGVNTVLDRLGAGTQIEPVAALAVSCAGRKWMLGERFGEEMDQLRALALPVIGFPSLGEVAPRRHDDGRYSPNLFHNVSFVLALLAPGDLPSAP